MIDALTGVLLIPAVAAALLAALPGYRLTARLNVLAALLQLRDRGVAVLRRAGVRVPICWWTTSTRSSSC